MNLNALQILIAGGESLTLELKKSTAKKDISTVKETGLIRAAAQSQALLHRKVSPLRGVIQPNTPSALRLDSTRALASADLVEAFTQLSVGASALR